MDKSRVLMESRFETLLSIFKLGKRKFKNIKTNEDIFRIDFSHVPNILENEQNKAINFLRNTLYVNIDY
jgi:hypothetical protein